MFRIKINSHLITKKITVGDKTYVFESKGGRLMILGLIIGFIARHFGYIDCSPWLIIGISVGACLVWDIITSTLFNIKMVKLLKDHMIDN